MMAEPANFVIRLITGPPRTDEIPLNTAGIWLPTHAIAALNAVENTPAFPLPAVLARRENPPDFSMDVTESHIAMWVRYAPVSTAPAPLVAFKAAVRMISPV